MLFIRWGICGRGVNSSRITWPIWNKARTEPCLSNPLNSWCNNLDRWWSVITNHHVHTFSSPLQGPIHALTQQYSLNNHHLPDNSTDTGDAQTKLSTPCSPGPHWLWWEAHGSLQHHMVRTALKESHTQEKMGCPTSPESKGDSLLGRREAYYRMCAKVTPWGNVERWVDLPKG